jgi:carbamoyl-phosphate synthase small subunit
LSTKAYLLLADGFLIEGKAVGKQGTSGGEICFNTGMTGYQEIYTDPSYYGQIIVNTTAHIGNYGTVADEQESDSPKISGIVVNEFSDEFSRKTATESLQSVFREARGSWHFGHRYSPIGSLHSQQRGYECADFVGTYSTPDQMKKLKKCLRWMDLELSLHE